MAMARLMRATTHLGSFWTASRNSFSASAYLNCSIRPTPRLFAETGASCTTVDRNKKNQTPTPTPARSTSNSRMGTSVRRRLGEDMREPDCRGFRQPGRSVGEHRQPVFLFQLGDRLGR